MKGGTDREKYRYSIGIAMEKEGRIKERQKE